MMSKNQFGVAVKAIIQYQDSFLLLKKSSSEDVNPDSYDLSGGRVEFGESLEQALKREVAEETGLSINVIRLINAWSTHIKKDFQLVGITYWCQTQNANIKLSGEHVSAQWLSLEELSALNLSTWLVDEFNLLKVALNQNR